MKYRVDVSGTAQHDIGNIYAYLREHGVAAHGRAAHAGDGTGVAW